MAGHSEWSGSEGILVKAMTRLRLLVVELGKYSCVSSGIRHWIIDVDVDDQAKDVRRWGCSFDVLIF